ncbi:molybdopterin biosynthesis protein MoeE [Marmoricola endophyticus]|uniref:Molybdopterin biosynthesis protein MoeE n=1 Tax=Marmoricola endophyticus TaxID=2040280 RepID=A0A917BHM1_9ACTN|nr:molybdenum cofactor biosynthesis protein MoaE [Marmoricola endophyticus]GGF41491.1 molybdopterin biosynthesis protein MoeE [Marmoricola endophyticus]
MTDATAASHPVVRLVEVREEPLDVAEVTAALGHDAGGAVDLFLGTVRDHDDDRGVTHLDYSAHPSAAEAMREVAAEVAEEYDVLAVAAVHRVGRLAIGDVAVITAVVTAHRAEAFVAGKALIDRLKERTPIWKHQVFADGDEEWVNTP